MGTKYDFCMSRAEYDDLCFYLTDDERKVLNCRRRGRRNAEIAAEMHCSERTIKRYAKSVHDKMHR